jgi:hypothetical protein
MICVKRSRASSSEKNPCSSRAYFVDDAVKELSALADFEYEVHVAAVLVGLVELDDVGVVLRSLERTSVFRMLISVANRSWFLTLAFGMIFIARRALVILCVPLTTRP